MPNYLSELLQFPGAPEQDANGVDLRSLLEQPAPMMPPMRKFAPMQVPQRPQPHWSELLPQILAGAGDVFTARARGRSDYLGRVMGGQEGRRNQAWNDAMMQAQMNQQADRAAEQDEWRRYGAETAAQDRAFNRALKGNEAMLIERLAGAQGESTKQAAEQQKIEGYKAVLSKAPGRKDLALEANKLRALNPQDKAAIDAVEQRLLEMFKLEESQPSPVRQQLEAMVGPKPAAWAADQWKATTGTPETGMPIFNSPRGYRALYGTPFTAPVPAGMDLAEWAGLVDWSGGPNKGGTGVHLQPPTEEDAAEAWRRVLERELRKSKPRPTEPWMQYSSPTPWIPQSGR